MTPPESIFKVGGASSSSSTATSPKFPLKKDIFADCSSTDDDDNDNFQEWRQAPSPSSSSQLGNLSLQEDSIMSLLLSSSTLSSNAKQQQSQQQQSQREENISLLKENNKNLEKIAQKKLKELRKVFVDNSKDFSDEGGEGQCHNPLYEKTPISEEMMSRKDVDWISMVEWINQNNSSIISKNEESSQSSERLFSLFRRMANEQKKRNRLSGGGGGINSFNSSK